MNKKRNEVSWVTLGIIGVIVVGVVVGIVYVALLQPNSAHEENANDGGSKQIIIKREIFYEQESSYTELPKLNNLTYAEYDSYWDSLTDFEYGHEYTNGDSRFFTDLKFKAPPNWVVENTIDKFSPKNQKVCFHFYGKEDIWGALIAINLSNVHVESPQDFANYYDRKKIFLELFRNTPVTDISRTRHIFRGFGYGVTAIESIFAYEAYSGFETPEDKYVNLTYYDPTVCGVSDIGFVFEFYIPVEELTLKTRTFPFMVAKSQFNTIFDWEYLHNLRSREN